MVGGKLKKGPDSELTSIGNYAKGVKARKLEGQQSSESSLLKLAAVKIAVKSL